MESSTSVPRKRSRMDGSADLPAKQAKKPKSGHEQPCNIGRGSVVRDTLLGHYYSDVQTLRQYALAKLPAASRIRRKKLSTASDALGKFLDNTIVASRSNAQDQKPDYRWEKWLSFSQRGDESFNITISAGLDTSLYSQPEIVQFVVWLLSSRKKAGDPLKNLLCNGSSEQVKALREHPWPQLLLLFGHDGERMMIDLLVDCAIFCAVESGNGNFYQLAGIPISELTPLGIRPVDKTNPLPPSEIKFVRSRMLYARAALNARGLVHFGLRHIHVLNRFPYKNSIGNDEDTNHECIAHILMYMFPRQFGLHNVFTSVADGKRTAQKLQDYTLREEEIPVRFPKIDARGNPTKRHIPKRLRSLKPLVKRLQILHGRCAYTEMIRHYCPIRQFDGQKSAGSSPQCLRKSQCTSQSEVEFSSITDFATPISDVSAFCQAVLSKVIPNEFWGQGPAQEHNKKCFLGKVHHFLYLRKFESMCLHEVMQGMKIQDIDWLTPPRFGSQKCSRSDMQKRIEIFYEFLYYVFDSLLMPLVRSNFYVTESSSDRCRLFFFRHDVWRYLAEPAMASLKTKMFKEVKVEDALRILDSRKLGLAYIRLLPKQINMRPIMNLGRRTLPKGQKSGLSRSINSYLSPINSVLNLEKFQNPNRLGASLFSVGDLYSRIKEFKYQLDSGRTQLYFAKVDVTAAYDTIPQDAMIKLIQSLPSHSRYRISKHAEVCPLKTIQGSGSIARASKKWPAVARIASDSRSFAQALEEVHATRRKNTIFVDKGQQETHNTQDLLGLSTTHIKENLVKIGKKYYRQKTGIPQGSVISSTLCNLFYASLEQEHLAFLRGDSGSLLVRLIDDFLLITTSQEKAIKFINTMHAGIPSYGVTVSLGKTLVNFPLKVDGMLLPTPLTDSDQFPYCGLLINTKTLNVTKPSDNPRDAVIFNSLTVEFSRCPGQNFKRKVINSFKIQTFPTLFDTSLNTRQTVLANSYKAFYLTATKMWAYAKCLSKHRQPGAGLVVDTIKALVDAAFLLMTSKTRKKRWPGYECCLGRGEVAWLAMVAFRQFLAKKQTGYREVVSWLEEEVLKLTRKKKKGMDCGVLVNVVKGVDVS